MKKSALLLLIVIVIVFLGTLFVLIKKNIVTNVPNQISTLIEPKQYVSPISINYLRSLKISSEVLQIEQELTDGSNYKRFIASYLSEGYKVYGLLTVPFGEMPEDGFPAIVFNHGYIDPGKYVTTEKYVAYVDSLAKNGFVVFKIDYRGNGKSQGDAAGSYFSSAYTIDAISALKSLQKFNRVNPNRIGMWGHSMAGNVTLRAMLVTNEIKSGVIWAGVVYSYEDFVKYGINDKSYTHKPSDTKVGVFQKDREVSPEIQKIRTDPASIDFANNFWQSISLTKNINFLNSPLQIHHAKNDSVVNIGYSRDLVQVLKANSKKYEYYEYNGGDHDIGSPYFESAMQRTIRFFKDNL